MICLIKYGITLLDLLELGWVWRGGGGEGGQLRQAGRLGHRHAHLHLQHNQYR